MDWPKLQPQLEPTTIGAKSANLGKATENGFSVPPGFVVTRKALELFLQDAGLKTLVQTVLSDENAGRADTYEDLCRQIHIAPVPDPLAKAVAQMADPLLAEAPGGVAVRSSGAHEDSATASFAGIYESYLGIRSIEDLWVSIKQCWCSAWSPQAIAYANRMGIALEYDSMAVLIQKLVIADSAGVLFTANPRTGNPWHFILESTFGLAQELVGSVGDVPADRFVLAWDTGDILERHIAEKPTTCVLGEFGVHSVPVSEERSVTPSLSDGMATSIAKLALDIDRVFGCRVDIEWAVADAEIHVVQVRPIYCPASFFPPLPPTERSRQDVGTHLALLVFLA
ncbi:PEP/pyruvate-binding domain-containing protein [Chloroflexi bacterium TSY]|nr:PEP/pyruvate-binding domain-containing protein [Chloroflexi bacterium TSY]